MNLKLFIIAIAMFYGAARSQNCDCPFTHAQDLSCRADFVGIVRIVDVDVDEVSTSPTNKIAAELVIKKTFKGKYEDYHENSRIYLYTPRDSPCTQQFWEGEQLMSGTTYRGGILVSVCDIREPMDSFKPKQIRAFESHIKTHTYERGCRYCKIKKPYDGTAVKINQCRDRYNEYPISTSACVPSGTSGRCSMQKVSESPFPMPQADTSINYDSVPVENPSGCNSAEATTSTVSTATTTATSTTDATSTTTSTSTTDATSTTATTTTDATTIGSTTSSLRIINGNPPASNIDTTSTSTNGKVRQVIMKIRSWPNFLSRLRKSQ